MTVTVNVRLDKLPSNKRTENHKRLKITQHIIIINFLPITALIAPIHGGMARLSGPG